MKIVHAKTTREEIEWIEAHPDSIYHSDLGLHISPALMDQMYETGVNMAPIRIHQVRPFALSMLRAGASLCFMPPLERRSTINTNINVAVKI